MRGLSLVAVSGGHSSSRCTGLSLSWPLLLQSTGSRRAGSVVAHGSSCSTACGIFPDQGSNPCPLHWQADSQPLCHQGSPYPKTFKSLLRLEFEKWIVWFFPYGHLVVSTSFIKTLSFTIYLRYCRHHVLNCHICLDLFWGFLLDHWSAYQWCNSTVLFIKAL